MKRRYDADSAKVTSQGSGTVLPAASRWRTAVRCSRSSGRTATRKPWTSSVAGQLLGDLADERRASRSRRPPDDQPAARHLLGLEDPVHGLPRRGDEVERCDLLERFWTSFSSTSAATSLARRALGDHAQEGQAGPDRAVEGERLVLPEDQVLDELARRVLHLEAMLARADAVERPGASRPSPRRPGRSGPRRIRARAAARPATPPACAGGIVVVLGLGQLHGGASRSRSTSCGTPRRGSRGRGCRPRCAPRPRAGSRPLRPARRRSGPGTREPPVVVLSSPSTQISTPGGSVMKKARGRGAHQLHLQRLGGARARC